MRLALLVPLVLVAGCATTPAADTAATDGPQHGAAAAPYEWTLDEERQLMRFAMSAHLEHQHHDAAEIIEHALHARELQESGREDEEALRIRRTAPKTEMLRRQLRRAAEILIDADKDGLAERIAALSDDLWEDPLAGTAQARPEHDGNDRELAVVKERMKVMRWGVEVWIENDRHDLAEQLEYAIIARRHAIEGRRDAEANEIREKAPDHGTLAELLHGAGRLYDEKGWETRAAACFELSKVFRGQWRREQEGSSARAEGGGDEDGRMREMSAALRRFMVRTERLELKVREMAERIEELEADKR